MRVLIDIETRSTLELKRSGVPNYARHPDTSITHVGYSIDAGPISMWQPRCHEMPRDLAAAVADPAATFIGHNAAFERLLLSGPAGRAIGFPQALAAIERWSCTAARAAAYGLPRRLEHVCEALSLPIQKDKAGPVVERVLELRQEGGGSSTTKTASLARQLDDRDGRIRHALVYCGAPATGRWSSVGAQLQNLPRNNVYDLPPILRDLQHNITVDEIGDIYGPPLRVISELLRPLIVAPQAYHLVTADFSQIEARVLAWLAGEHHRVAMFRAYDDGGPDPYSITAARLYSSTVAEVTPAQRQSGKIAELALGFQGGHRAIQKMAKNFNLRIPKATAEEWKLAWRADNPAIERFWHDLEAAARAVISHAPGHAVERVGLIQFSRTPYAMSVRLPSARKLTYWRPSLRQVETPWGELRLQPHCFGQNNLTRRWENGPLYGGLICENVVQATARDILADALIRLDAAGFNPVLTVHDEIMCETTAPANAIASLMNAVPNWALGLPSAASVVATRRYTKA